MPGGDPAGVPHASPSVADFGGIMVHNDAVSRLQRTWTGIDLFPRESRRARVETDGLREVLGPDEGDGWESICVNAWYGHSREEDNDEQRLPGDQEWRHRQWVRLFDAVKVSRYVGRTPR